MRTALLRPSRWPVLVRALFPYVLIVLAGAVVGLALELAIQLFGAVVVPDALEGFPVWYHVGKAVLFQLAQVAPAFVAGALAPRHAGVVGAITAIVCALAVDLAFHGTMPASLGELISPLSLAAGAGILGAVSGLAGTYLAQRRRARRACAPTSV